MSKLDNDVSECNNFSDLFLIIYNGRYQILSVFFTNIHAESQVKYLLIYCIRKTINSKQKNVISLTRFGDVNFLLLMLVASKENKFIDSFDFIYALNELVNICNDEKNPDRNSILYIEGHKITEQENIIRKIKILIALIADNKTSNESEVDEELIREVLMNIKYILERDIEIVDNVRNLRNLSI